MLQSVKDYITEQQNNDITFDKLFIRYLIDCQDRTLNQEYISTLNNRGINSVQTVLDKLLTELRDVMNQTQEGA